jgi:hypothetical protein
MGTINEAMVCQKKEKRKGEGKTADAGANRQHIEHVDGMIRAVNKV